MSVGKTIKKYFLHHPFKIFLVIGVIILVTILALLPAQILKYIIDEVILKKELNIILKVSSLYFLSYFLVGIITFFKDFLMLKTSQEMLGDLRCDMMKHYQNINYNTIVNNDSGTFEAYFNNDVNSINELFTSGVVDMATDLFKMFGILISLFVFSYKFGILVLCVLPFLIIFTSFIRKRMLKVQLKTKGLEGNVNKILLENVENIEEIKICKSGLYAASKYDKILSNHFRASQRSNFYDAIFSPFMQIVKSLVIVFVLIISGYNANIFGMSPGMIIASISLVTDLFMPIENLGMEIQTIQKSFASVKRINGFLAFEEMPKKEHIKINDNIIEFKDVSFSYDKNEVISDFNLKISGGEKLVLMGPSGSGKSTIMKLAMGILNPTKGSVTIGDTSIFMIDEAMRKELFAIVYQKPFFSGESIYNEIALNDNKISKEAVKEALGLVGLGYIDNLDMVLNPKEYSLGELSLFNIARVIVRNPKVIFLDEMNAKIDPITSKQIIEVINKISKDKIVISINHYALNLENAKILKIGANYK